MKTYKIQTLNDGEIEFKPISLEDADRFYNSILQDDNPYLEEFIFNRITDNKYADTELSSGVIPLVVFTSMKLSGFIKSKKHFLDLVDQSRHTIENNSFFGLYLKICSVMPKYSLEELREKTLEEILTLVAFAEILSGKQLTDTKKERAKLEKEEQEKNSSAPVKKGIKSLTKQDLDIIKNMVNFEDYDSI